MNEIIKAEGIMDWLLCPLRFETLHLKDVDPPLPPVSTRARRSKHFQDTMHQLIMFFFLKAMSGQILTSGMMVSRWGKNFLKDYDVQSILGESHESSSTHHNLVSLNTIGVEVIHSFCRRFLREEHSILSLNHEGVLVLDPTCRLGVNIHCVRSRKGGGKELVYLYTGLQKPPLRLFAWPVFATGLLYEQEYGERLPMILSCPAVSTQDGYGQEYRLPNSKDIRRRFEEVVKAIHGSNTFPPAYASNCSGCPAQETCSTYGWRGFRT